MRRSIQGPGPRIAEAGRGIPPKQSIMELKSRSNKPIQLKSTSWILQLSNGGEAFATFHLVPTSLTPPRLHDISLSSRTKHLGNTCQNPCFRAPVVLGRPHGQPKHHIQASLPYDSGRNTSSLSQMSSFMALRSCTSPSFEPSSANSIHSPGSLLASVSELRSTTSARKTSMQGKTKTPEVPGRFIQALGRLPRRALTLNQLHTLRSHTCSLSSHPRLDLNFWSASF